MSSTTHVSELLGSKEVSASVTVSATLSSYCPVSLFPLISLLLAVLFSCSAQLLSTKQSSQGCADYSVGRSVSRSGDLSLSRSQMQHDSSITTHSVTGATTAPTDSPAIRTSYSPSSPPAPVATWLYSENSWIRISAGLDCWITSK